MVSYGDYYFWFIRKTIQVDNGSEFVNDEERTDRKSGFEKVERVIELKLGKLFVLENISEVECDG